MKKIAKTAGFSCISERLVLSCHKKGVSYFLMSHFPPLSGPIRSIMWSSFSFFICLEMALRLISNRLLISVVVTNGSDAIRERIESLVFCPPFLPTFSVFCPPFLSTFWWGVWGACGVASLGCTFHSSVGSICKYLFLRTQLSPSSKFLKKRTR